MMTHAYGNISMMQTMCLLISFGFCLFRRNPTFGEQNSMRMCFYPELDAEREKDWHFFGQLFISFTLNLMVFLLSRNHCLNMHNISIVSVPTFLDRFLWCAAMKVPGSNNNEISFSINYQFMYSTKVNMRKEKQSVHIKCRLFDHFQLDQFVPFQLRKHTYETHVIADAQ